MTKIKVHEPKSLTKLLEIIEDYQSNREIVWYRGVNNSSYKLEPSIKRTRFKATEETILNIEKKVSSIFSQRSPPFVRENFSSDWRMLFFMQHYGIPTRLLDWSESPFVALYFALSGAKRHKTNNSPLSDATLWMCDPKSWNKASLNHISFDGDILDENCEEIKSYAPSTDINIRATKPVMIHGTHNSARIVAQRGVFALFGNPIIPLTHV
ncbi:FRG domain-containing protein [Novosphingobium sp. YJ-S2-02]|uniref:FRG domain-containing protein n=1 Tax=Novosphingobium aureum TaxID=2792964 RepID=A0A931MK08_9SPHN|nr:FRG domain-containing protein [Novosphingobium aureum]MBH0112387.1 FRG domain-containing protein [Novosphingobium aureum]